MASAAIPHISEEAYLKAERKAEYKSEYYDGQVFAMAGSSRWHSLIGTNIITELNVTLHGRCEVHGSDMRLRVPETRLYTYPDVTVTCGEPLFMGRQQDILLNPTIIIEVLSESTRRYDRGAKFRHYKTIPSLQEYVLVAQDKRFIEHYTKVGEGEWRVFSIDEATPRVHLSSIGLELTFDHIYREVEFPRRIGRR